MCITVLDVSDLSVRLQAFELGDLFWEHDPAVLRAMTSAQRRAQAQARERLHRHAQRVQEHVEAAAGADARQRAAIAGIVDLTGLLFEHARGELDAPPQLPGPRARRPLQAPARLWSATTAPSQSEPQPAPVIDGPAICRRCGLPLEREPLAGMLGRPANQGWRHVDSRKTHLPDPVAHSSPPAPVTLTD